MNAYLIDRLQRYLKMNFGPGTENGMALIQEAIDALALADATEEHWRDAIMSASAELELYNMGCGGSAKRGFAHIRHALEDAPRHAQEFSRRNAQETPTRQRQDRNGLGPKDGGSVGAADAPEHQSGTPS